MWMPYPVSRMSSDAAGNVPASLLSDDAAACTVRMISPAEARVRKTAGKALLGCAVGYVGAAL